MRSPLARLGIIAVAVLLLIPMTALADPQANRNPHLTRISGASPFAPDCNAPLGEGQTGERSIGAEVEISLTVDPHDPDRMVAAWIQDSYAGIGTAATHDGGQTWTNTVVPGLSACSGAPGVLMTADPWLSTGADGTVYLASMSWRDRGFHSQVSTSADGGLTWSPPVSVLPEPGASHDKPSITADPDRPCVAHATWTEMVTLMGNEVALAHASTDDCGRTWSLPNVVAISGVGDAPDNPTVPFAAEVLVLPDGDLMAVWFANPIMEADDTPHWIRMSRSADGGRTWSPPATVAEYVPGIQGTDPETGENIKTHYEWPSVAVAPDGGVHIAIHNLTPAGTEEIRIVSSPDAGDTWTTHVAVGGDGAQPFLPSLAVAGNGSLGFTYYDMGADELGDDELTTQVWLATSRDGGQTWRQRPLSGAFDMRAAMNKLAPSVGLWVGDYHGFVGLPNGFAATFGLAAPHAVEGANDVFFTTTKVPPAHNEPPGR